MRNPGGYATLTEPVGQTVERDTFTCSHCNRVVFVKPGQDPSVMGGFCRVCMKHICNAKPCHEGCKPFLKQIEQLEKRYEFRRKVFG